jgi:hypothetical protein
MPPPLFREESEKLIKLIETRVVEASYPNRQEKDVYSQTLECAQFSPVQVSPEMRSVAIAESKKWLEEKKRSTPSNSKTIDLGTCKLNTNMSLFVSLPPPPTHTHPHPRIFASQNYFA